MDNVIGHILAKKKLLNNTHVQTWLICGKKGIGKAKLAKAFANYLTMNKDVWCYSNILLIENNNDTIGISEIRKIKKNLYLSAINHPRKVVIIDAIDDLTINASNSLLKILEEPPKNSVIILISHNYYRVTEVIRSRCFILNLLPLNLDETQQVINNNQINFNCKDNFFTLYNGTPGMVTKNIADEINLYKNLLDITIYTQKDISQINEIINTDIDFHKIGLILLNIILNIIKNIIGIKKDINIKKDKIVDDIEFWMEKYLLLQKLINCAENFSLDKKHTLLNLVYYLKR